MATDEDALAAALAQFNEGLEAQAADRAAQRAIDKAERKKQQAAAHLKKLDGDPDASAEDKATANDEYRKAVEEFNQLRSGEPVETGDEATAEEDSPSEPAASDSEPAEGDSDATDGDAATSTGEEASGAAGGEEASDESAGPDEAGDAGEPAQDEPAAEGADEGESDG
ncbi:MAG: hypothetical protein ACR2PK_15305 [Acidimicrobiales bacterium]